MNEIKKQVPFNETATTKTKQAQIPKKILSPMIIKQLLKSNNLSKKGVNQT